MAQYSHSKLSTFEQCKLKYKFKYIDKITPDFKSTIEAHLGSSVHNTFEWMYHEILKGRVPELDEVIQYYSKEWQDNYTEEHKIVKEYLKPEDYFNKGVKFLIDYYVTHQPFEDGTLEMEKQLNLKLHPEKPHTIIGYIDRLVFDKERNRYEIHDYKTANFLPKQEKFDQDRQLALYAIAIRELFGKDKKILLIWHYLNHNQKIISKRTDEEYDKLRQDIINLIDEIESTKEFPPNPSQLCDWCEYKNSCPVWNKKLG